MSQVNHWIEVNKFVIKHSSSLEEEIRGIETGYVRKYLECNPIQSFIDLED